MNIKYDEMRSIKALNLPDILRNYGMNLKPHGPDAFFAICPFHEDQNPSLSVSKKGDVWLWHCFGCNSGGTVIDFMMKKERLSLSDTYQKLRPMIPKTGGGNGHDPNRLELLKSVSDFYHKTFLEDKRAVEYLRGRGIKSPEIYSSFKIGFANGSLKKSLPLKGPMIKALRDIGILNDEGNEVFYNSLVIPLFDDDANVVCLYGRNITGKQHLYLKGPHKGLVNRQGAFGTEKLILTESIIDALSLYEMGVRNVIPCYGTGGFTEDHRILIQKQKIKEIEIAFDNDNAGTAGAQDLARRLGLKTFAAKLPEQTKDLNDFLLAGKTKEDYLSLERDSSAPAAPQNDVGGVEIQKEKGALHFSAKGGSASGGRSGGRHYRILLPEYDSIQNLRVRITLTVKGSYHVDVVDLYSERSRRSYSKKVSKAFSLPESDIEADLYRILEELEKDRSPKEEVNAADRPMTDEEKGKASKSLKNPHLIQEILEDLEKIGCVGEEQNKLLGYLVTISRKLQEPLSLTIVSQSGAGKSNLADVLESILPKEDVIRLSRITPQALYYMEKDALKRKVLIIEEKEGSTQADYSIRVLQSKKSLRLAVALKDIQTGKMKTHIFEVEGPVVVIETTTRTDINPENGSRVFIAYMDESEEQTKRIHLFQQKQKTIEGRSMRLQTDKLIRKHQNIQRLLREVVVDIPFVRDIHFPTKWMRTRRDYQKFLNLIEAATFLHQHQRQSKTLEDGAECIESTLGDYRIAYSLACDIFGDGFSELMKPERDFYEIIKQMLQEKEIVSFQRRTIREYSKLPDHVVRRFLDTLVQMEYLLVLEGKNGIRFEYKLNPEPLEQKEIIQGLTTPEELERMLVSGSTTTLRTPCANLAARLNGLNHTT